jgi:uncharacterized OB-fold protein
MSYPEPTLTELNRPLIEAWHRGELVLQHCAACSYVIFFPRETCPQCWSTQLEWKTHSGRGTVVSCSRVYSHVTEPFVKESPVIVAEIELADGGAMLARIVDVPRDAEIETGAPVELVPLSQAERYTLPTFRLI